MLLNNLKLLDTFKYKDCTINIYNNIIIVYSKNLLIPAAIRYNNKDYLKDILKELANKGSKAIKQWHNRITELNNCIIRDDK